MPTDKAPEPTVETPSLQTLARRLCNAAYSHGMADQTPDRSDAYYSKADDKSTAALSRLLDAIAEHDASIAAERARGDRLEAEVEVEKSLRQEAQDFHRAAMLDAYKLLGIDASDGEIRYKWVALEIASLKRRAALNQTPGA